MQTVETVRRRNRPSPTPLKRGVNEMGHAFQESCRESLGIADWLLAIGWLLFVVRMFWDQKPARSTLKLPSPIGLDGVAATPGEGRRFIRICFLLEKERDREIAPRAFALPATSDRRKLTMLVNSLDYDQVNVYAGVWGAKAGKFWLDDWTFEEIGPVNVLCRPGTPVTVKNEDGSITYTEWKDYTPLGQGHR